MTGGVMYRTIDESFREYQEELRKFRVWLETVPNNKKGATGIETHTHEEWAPWVPNSEPTAWPSEYLNEARKRRLFLRGWEKALGLTEERMRKAYEVAGFRIQ